MTNLENDKFSEIEIISKCIKHTLSDANENNRVQIWRWGSRTKLLRYLLFYSHYIFIKYVIYI